MKSIIRHYHQNVVGISPAPEFENWAALADFLHWHELTLKAKEAKLSRLRKEFDDETLLLDLTFRKLMGLLTPLGLIFAFGRSPMNGNHASSALFIISFCVTSIFVVWALSTRFKVLKRPVDHSAAALMVDDGEGKVLAEELASEMWWLYQWRWHRYHTRLAIDRLFLFASLFTIVTLSIIGFNVL